RRARDDEVAPARELLVIRTAEHELHGASAAAATAATAAVAAAHEGVDANVGDLFPLLVQVGQHFRRADLALAPRLQRDVDDARSVVAPARHADDAALDLVVVEVLLERGLDLHGRYEQAVVARTLGRLDLAVELATILDGRVLLRDVLHEHVGAERNR